MYIGGKRLILISFSDWIILILKVVYMLTYRVCGSTEFVEVPIILDRVRNCIHWRYNRPDKLGRWCSSITDGYILIRPILAEVLAG